MIDLKSLLVDLLVQIFGEPFRAFFQRIFGSAKLPEPGDIIKVGDAPDEVHRKFQAQIMDLITSALGSYKIIFGFTKKYLPGIVDTLINKAWDAYFLAQIAAGDVKSFAACGFAPKTMAAPATLTEAELFSCKAEAGI
jgi:hypothetical protein